MKQIADNFVETQYRNFEGGVEVESTSDSINSESLDSTDLSYENEQSLLVNRKSDTLTVALPSYIALYKINMAKQKILSNNKKKQIIRCKNPVNGDGYGSLDHSHEATLHIRDDLIQGENHNMSSLSICAVLSTAFSYGCIMTTLFLLTLPIICERIESESAVYYGHTISKSMALGVFAVIAGLTQLFCPLVGMMSDNIIPHPKYSDLQAMGKRIPYLILGTVLTIVGFAGQIYASSPIHPVHLLDDIDRQHLISTTDVSPTTSTTVLFGSWFLFAMFFFIHNIGLNVVYTVMVALIPDLIPTSQTGIANGSLAMMVVTGSLFGFAMFHTQLQENITSMYKMYIGVSLFCSFITYIFVRNREICLREERHKQSKARSNSDEEARSANTDEEAPSPIIEADFEQDEQKAKGCLTIFLSPLHTLFYTMIYEPMSTKSFSEITSAYTIDRTKYSDFFFVTISRFFYYMGISSQTFFLYFIHDALHQSRETSNPESAVALLAMIGQTAGAITCYPMGILSDQYFGGRRKPFVYFACFLLAFGNMSLLMCKTLSQMIHVIILLGSANGVYLTMDTSLAIDTLDEDDSGVQGSNNNAAQMLGVWGVFGFLGSSIGPLSGGIVLVYFGNMGHDTNREGDETKFYSVGGYVALFTLCALYFFFSALSLAFVKKKSV